MFHYDFSIIELKLFLWWLMVLVAFADSVYGSTSYVSPMHSSYVTPVDSDPWFSLPGGVHYPHWYVYLDITSMMLWWLAERNCIKTYIVVFMHYYYYCCTHVTTKCIHFIYVETCEVEAKSHKGFSIFCKVGVNQI